MLSGPTKKPARKEFERVLDAGDPNGIRTRVTAVRGQRTRPLYDGAVRQLHEYATSSKAHQTGWQELSQ